MSAGAALDASAVFSFASASSYVPWKIASTVILFWLLLNASTALLTASPFVPPMACQKTILLAGSTPLSGAFGPVSAAVPLPAGEPPPHAVATSARAMARLTKVRMSLLLRGPRVRGPRSMLALDGAGGQSANELTLAEEQEDQRRRSDHDDAGHEEAPAQRLLEAQLREPDLRRAHERLVRDEERPEVLVPGAEERVHRHRAEGRTREREHDL